MYPFIDVELTMQKILRQQLITSIVEDKIFDDNITFDNTDEYACNSIDWPMYGSSIIPSNDIHKITHIYMTLDEKIFDTLIIRERDDINVLKKLIETLSIHKNKFKTLKNIDTNEIDNIYKTGDISDSVIAKLFHSFYPNKFLYDYDLQSWYCFTDFGIYQNEGSNASAAASLNFITDNI